MNKTIRAILIVIAVVLLAVLGVVFALTASAQEPEPEVVCGDVNHNGRIDFSDIVTIYEWSNVSGAEPPTMLQIILGDIDGDGMLTTNDAVLLADHIIAGTEPQECGNAVSVLEWQATLLSEASNSSSMASPNGNEMVDVNQWNESSTNAVLGINWETIRQKHGNELINWDDVLVANQRIHADHGDNQCPIRYFWLLAATGTRPIWLIVRCYGDSDELIDFVDELYNPQVLRVYWLDPVEDLPWVKVARIIFQSLN